MLPRGANVIAKARADGQRPADPVLVSFVGSLPWDGPTVYAQPSGAYDWRFLFGLPTMVFVRPGLDVRDNLREICDLAALYTTLVDVEKQQAASVLAVKPLRLLAFPKHHPGWKELFA